MYRHKFDYKLGCQFNNAILKQNKIICFGILGKIHLAYLGERVHRVFLRHRIDHIAQKTNTKANYMFYNYFLQLCTFIFLSCIQIFTKFL